MASQTINRFDKEKHGESNQDKADDGVHEHAEVDGYRTRRLCSGDRGIRPGHLAFFEDDKDIRKINIPKKQTDRRHDDILNQ